MILLALESSSAVASAALLRDGELLAELNVNNGHTHSETLLPMVEQLLRMCRLTVDDVDAFACAEGPGSFTGIRIGMATLKGLAFGKGKPCIAVPTLEALAENLVGTDGDVFPVVDARRDQVFTAHFRVRKGKVTRLSDDAILSLDDLGKEFAECKKKPWLTGDGYGIAKAKWTAQTADTPEKLRYANAYSVGLVAFRMLKDGKTATDAAVTPTYLRLSQAEQSRLERRKN